VPCITLRANTERPITCEEGTNVIVGNRKEQILRAADAIFKDHKMRGRIPEKWDGKAAERIVEVLLGQSAGRMS
jgi:UDP-N-acetylglucosamine 2-epimerase (non-hydrolysing)